MSAHAQQERQALADLLADVGPDAPTLCAGWRTGDLAAHLVVRERRPDAAPGLVVPALAGYLDRVQRSVRDGRSWQALVDTVRTGPPLLLRPLDEPVNTVEYFVHHEDVRRAGGDAEPRVDADLDEALWRVLRRSAVLLSLR
ncbi:MAG: TIGR03085 family metal-binding protein, partial [Actinomycetota bacterium]|nr:TIGR03085 family metal-binding protein [Actinomycetota bacterium]